MASSQSVSFVIEAAEEPHPEVVAAALPALPLTPEAVQRACARLAIAIPAEAHRAFPQPPEIWRRFQEEGCEFVACGRWRAEGALAVELQVWTDPSDEPDVQFGGEDWAQAAAQAPAVAADLLACLYAVTRVGSALVIAFDAHSDEQLRAAVLLTAFARAALPPQLRATCLAALPLGAPEPLVSGEGAAVVAYPTRAAELGAAYNLVSGQGGVLYSVTDGQNGGAKPDAGCRAYAQAAAKVAEKGALAVLRFARKAARLGEEAIQDPETMPLAEIARVAAGADSPPTLDAALRGWHASADPDRFAPLLDDDDWAAVTDSVLIDLAGVSEPPFGGGELQARAMRELAGRPHGSRGVRLLQGSPDDPAALEHAVRLVRAGLLGADLAPEWCAPLAAALSGDELALALGAALAQGAAARPLSLALLERCRQAPHPAIADVLREAQQAGRLNDIELALPAEQAYDASAHADLGLLEGLLQQAGWRLEPEQRRRVIRGALSREGRAVGPRLLFVDGRLRAPESWLEEIVHAVSDLPATERADLRVQEWAALWAAAARHSELAERLAPRLDERMALLPDVLTRALMAEEAWLPWLSASSAPAAVKSRSCLEWLAGRGPHKPYLEEWKAAVEGLGRLDADGLRRLAAAAGPSRELFDTIPYFESEQTADLIRLAPDDATRDLWAQLLDRFSDTDPYRPLNESAASYVLSLAGGEVDEAAALRRQGMQWAAAGDWNRAAEAWPLLAELSGSERPAAAAVGALRGGDLDAACWADLEKLPAAEAVGALLEFIRKRLTLNETAGLAGPLLNTLRKRPQWLEGSSRGVPALELLATVESRVGIVVPVMQIARLAAASGYEERPDWWLRLAEQARACPRHDGHPNPLENWEHTRAYLYDRAQSLPRRAARLFRRALDEGAGAGETPAEWPAATLR